jgi:hypothetical protein
MSLNCLVHTAIWSARADRERFFETPSGSSCFECTERKAALNLHGFELHRPSSKGTKLPLQVIKASINQFTNVHSLILQKYVTEEVRNWFTYCTLRCVLVHSRALWCATHHSILCNRTSGFATERPKLRDSNSPMQQNVTLAKPHNKEKSFTNYLETPCSDQYRKHFEIVLSNRPGQVRAYVH